MKEVKGKEGKKKKKKKKKERETYMIYMSIFKPMKVPKLVNVSLTLAALQNSFTNANTPFLPPLLSEEETGRPKFSASIHHTILAA